MAEEIHMLNALLQKDTKESLAFVHEKSKSFHLFAEEYNALVFARLCCASQTMNHVSLWIQLVSRVPNSSPRFLLSSSPSSRNWLRI